MASLFALLGVLGLRVRPETESLDWGHGMVVVALTWVIVPVIGADTVISVRPGRSTNMPGKVIVGWKSRR